jgi:hypothetical protein
MAENLRLNTVLLKQNGSQTLRAVLLLLKVLVIVDKPYAIEKMRLIWGNTAILESGVCSEPDTVIHS